MNTGSKRLERSSTDKVLGGVCGGLAAYTGLDATLVRIISAALIVFTGIGPILYILAWILMPTSGNKAIAEDWAGKATDWYHTQQQNKTTNRSGVHNPNDLR